MDRADLHRLTRTLMNEHGLNDWKIEMIQSKNTAGQCHYGARIISMSVPVAEARSEHATRMTVLHEIAHALVGAAHKHDYTWARKCREIGGNGEAKWSDKEAQLAMAKWIGTCPNGHTTTRNARSEKMFRISCGQCKRHYDPALLLSWLDTATRITIQPGGYVGTRRVETMAANNSVPQRRSPVIRRTDIGFTDIEALFRD